MNTTTKRILSASVLMPLFITCLYSIKTWGFLTAFMAIGMVIEFFNICRRPIYFLLVSLYIIIGCYAFYIVRRDTGFSTSLWAFVSIWISDSAAYFGGKILKGPKLAPSISPNKTISGLLIGIGVGGIAAIAMAYHMDIHCPVWIILILLTIGHAGDLLESWIKRRLKVKDTSGLIPGHGGIFDRMDSCLSFFMVLYVLIKFYSF